MPQYERLSLVPDRPERVWTIGHAKQFTIERLAPMCDSQMCRSLRHIWLITDLSRQCRHNGLHLLPISWLAFLFTGRATDSHPYASPSPKSSKRHRPPQRLRHHFLHTSGIQGRVRCKIMRVVRAELMN